MAPRSRTGCLTCRQRKLKCSEERPICAQCVKANRECIPSSGITFRHQQNPSMNGDPVARESLKSFYGYKETFGHGTVWVNIPQELTFVHTSNPYEDEDGTVHDENDDSILHTGETSFENDHTHSDFTLSQASYPAYATHGLEALSAVASQDQYNYAPPPATMAHQSTPPPQSQAAVSPQNIHATPSQNLGFILNPSSTLSPQSNIDPRLHTQESTPQEALTQSESPTHVRTRSYTSVRPFNLHSKGTRPLAIREPELAFLLRDFSERSGCWMDLFDLDRFFGARVPVLAVRFPLLLYSCAALSAKSLARVDGRKPVMGGQISPLRQSRMEHWPGPSQDAKGWVRKARENYDVAVSLLRQALAGDSRPPSSALPVDVTQQTVSTALDAPLPTTDSDELVAATAILCVYEFLDASGPEWSRHLDGAKSLFEVAKERMVPLTLPPSPTSNAHQVTRHLIEGNEPTHTAARGLTPGRIAVFWNVARQDFLEAFINHANTRLETADLPMWKSAGLKLTQEGYVCPSNPQHPDYMAENAMQDDMISNALIWLMAKLVNFIAAGDTVPEALSPMGLGVRQHELLEYWTILDEQLKVWHDGLPDTFSPAAVRTADSMSGIDEKWFARSMCASTMQSYHFARIQLLHNRPQVSTAMSSLPRTQSHGAGATSPQSLAPGQSLAARNASYAHILQKSRMHAQEIVSIGLGRADEGTRIHSVQPLWTAGLVLGIGAEDDDDDEHGSVDGETEMWRSTIIRQLRGIERDTGWASEYRVQSLLEVWGLPHDWGEDIEL